jgi:hypothetical protein
VVEDLGAAVAPVDDMVAVAAHGGTGSAWHGPIIAPLPLSCKQKAVREGALPRQAAAQPGLTGASVVEWVRRNWHRP